MINPFESNENPYPESVVKVAQKYKERQMAGKTTETYHIYYMEHEKEIQADSERNSDIQMRKLVAERARILRRLIALNSLIGDY